MGQDEVLRLLEVNPRICTKEVAKYLDYSERRASKLLRKMVGREIKEDSPTGEELKEILKKFPTSACGVWRLRVFEVKDE